jgi:hypothetical protein
MRKVLVAMLFAFASTAGVPAQTAGDLCHVYVVDTEKARQALAITTGKFDLAAMQAAQTVFPEFRTAIGEEELTTKTYPLPGSKLIITASVYYTDESMASADGVDSMLVGVAVSSRAERDALALADNSVAEVTFNNRDTVRTKKYFKTNGRLYLVGLECRCKERKQSK